MWLQKNKVHPVLAGLLLFTCYSSAQTAILQKPLCLLIFNTPQQKGYDWSKIIKIDIDRDKYPGKFKAIADILHHLSVDAAGREIFENIARNNQGILSIRDKEDVVSANTVAGVDAMFAADYGVKLIKQDMKYDPIDNDLVINFTKSGEMLSFDEGTHHFFKVSLNNIVATELERAGQERTVAEKNCRALIAKMNQKENYLFNNYKDLFGEKFTIAEIELCRKKQVTIHNIKTNTKDTYTYTDVVADALKEYRRYAEERKKNAYELDAREMPLSRKYTDKLGEPHRSREPVFNVRLGENRSRDLQFGPATGTDYIALSGAQQNEYKNLTVYYDNEKQEHVDNATVLTRIKEEYAAQLKFDTRALNSKKLLEYVDRIKTYFDKNYKPTKDYEALAEREVEQVMKRNPYLEGANDVIMAETMYQQTKKSKN
ncbi:MAG: hypothetical protein K0Q79_2573 [Flavipsychrobacter sp.]|jgi:hypothetical protein|nr:hypothetical protein [Flavipsychrobacter sp.]